VKAARSIAFRSLGSRLVALLSVLVMACAANPHSRSKDEWSRARQVAEEYLRGKYGTSWKVVDERHGVPFMFHVDAGDEATVLVHDNAVFTQRGMAGLDRYLRGSRCVEQQLPSVPEMITLIHFFDAYPPDPHRQGYFKQDATHAAWRPQLQYLDGGRAQLTLYYRIDQEDDGNDYGDGDETESSLRAWTLRMDPGQMPVWTKETRIWDRVKDQWRVDHTN
jgi:hypothetical protein